MTLQPTNSGPHIPVMLDEVLDGLALRDGGAYVDGTFGAGGYSRAILGAADTTLWAIDRDPDAIERGQPLMEEYAPRLVLLQGRFGEMADLLRTAGVERVDGIVLDLGVSSPQINKAERGFSFRFDGPLDMRMDKQGPSAADFAAFQATQGPSVADFEAFQAAQGPSVADFQAFQQSQGPSVADFQAFQRQVSATEDRFASLTRTTSVRF